MKKYNKPEIVTLALDNVDVIETSGTEAAMEALKTEGFETSHSAEIKEQISTMSQKWSW